MLKSAWGVPGVVDPRYARIGRARAPHGRGSYSPGPGHVPDVHRRTVLAGAAAAVPLAGCLGADAGEAAAARATLDGQPYLGDPPEAAEKLVVAFEDPACPTCRRFHEEELGALRRDVVEPGSASLVWRPYRYTPYAWQTPAIHAVLAATDRSNAAGWALVEFYYARQADLDAGNVLEETAAFLDGETGVDGETVAGEAEDRAYESLLETAESEGDEVGVTSTPTFLLFEDGAYRTTITGVQDASLFQAAFES